MLSKDISEVFNLILNDKTIRFLTILITLFTIAVAAIVSPIAAVVIYTYYILGFAFCWFFIKYQSKATTYIQRLASFYRGRISVKNKFKHSCSICDDLSCKRHQSKSVSPWKHLDINEDLNSSIEHFYNRIIDNFITSWYGQFTADNDFLNELRYCLRYASATLITRFLEINSSQVVANKLIPCAVKHIDDYMYMQQCAKLKNVRFNDVIVEYLGKRLHVATTSRSNELNYLKHMVFALLTNVLPEPYLKCRNYSVLIREILAGWVFLPLMDVLADPNLINSLVILAITYKPKKTSKSHQHMETVEFLENFIVNDKKKKSLFSTDLNTIKNNTNLLYALMQYLKKQGNVNLLQFCLDVDDFNNKLLTPDLSKKQLENLYSEALKLYNEYLDKDSLSFVCCPNEIAESFNKLLKNGVYSIAKLRTSKPLFQAYEHTFNVLENVWLPQFYHSNEFYDHICGNKVTPVFNKASTTNRSLINFGSPIKDKNRKYLEINQGTVSKISSGLGKIRGVLKTHQPIEGSLYPLENQNVEDGAAEDMFLGDCDNLFRDLSTWRVSINSYQANATNKIIHFGVKVQRLDTVSDNSKSHWMVLRKDQDFYTLKAKLVEFHGETEICDSPLPSRKAGSSIDMRMFKYEEFIKKLLQKSTLRGSDLLYTFLTTEEDFASYIAISTPVNQDFGNIYQSVAYKLRKEKGQYLDSFMTTFLNSTGQSNKGKLDWAEIGDELNVMASSETRNAPLPKTYRNYIFNDNFGIKYKVLNDTSSSSFQPVGITECVFYLLRHIFKVPHGFLKLYVSLCNVAQDFVDYLCQKLIKRELKLGLSQANLSYLIKLLEGVVFHSHISPTKEELERRKLRAFEELEGILSTSFIRKIIGNQMNNGLATILEILQNPHYNKQLVYNLLDIIVTEMYPALGMPEE